MDLTTLTSADFKHITKLLERKESILSEISGINRELGGGAPAKRAAGRPRKVTKPAKAEKPGKALTPESKAIFEKAAKRGKRGRMKRGQLKENIIALLKKSGKEGLKVKDIATKLKVKPANVHVWFGSTGKKITQIKNQNGKRVWVG